MKIYVLYDKQGHIKGTAVTQSKNVGVKSNTGLSVLQLERTDSNPAELEQYLLSLHHNFVVKINSGKSQLVKKSLKKKV